MYSNVFDQAGLESLIQRFMSLTPKSQPLWGKMSVAQMLAHCCVTYEMVYTDKHPRPSALMRWVLRTFVKRRVAGPVAYPHSTPTAPAFRITDDRDFTVERERLIGYMCRVAAEGKSAFDGRESLSFGKLTADEWNVLFAKHLDHHLRQFGK